MLGGRRGKLRRPFVSVRYGVSGRTATSPSDGLVLHEIALAPQPGSTRIRGSDPGLPHGGHKTPLGLSLSSYNGPP